MKILRVILSFFVLFSFPVPVFYNSWIVAIALSSLIYIFNKSLFREAVHLFKKKFIWKIIVIYFFVLIVGVFPPIFHGTFDFSILKANLLVLILVFCSFFIYPILVYNIPIAKAHNHILRLVIVLFLIQSFIQTSAFIFAPVKDFVQFFQKESISEREMGGIRALGLTGNPFFDLAAGYGLCFILFFFLIVSEKTFFSLKNSFVFLFLLIGCFYAGRTAFVGLSLALFFYFFSISNTRIKIISFLKLLMIIGFLTYFFYRFFLPDETKVLIEDKLLPFAFEFIYAYFEGGKFSTESTEVLDSMYFPLSWSTFFLGDGRYIGKDGAYYLHTDAGIMRNILFYGIGGLLLNIIGQTLFFVEPIKQLKRLKKRIISASEVNQLFFLLNILCYFFITHYKGEVLLFMPIMQVMLIWVLYSFVQQGEKYNE